MEMAENGEGSEKTDDAKTSVSKLPVIPKFTSFKPPPKPSVKASEIPSVKEDREKRHRHDDDRERKSRKHRHREERSPEKHRDKRRRERSPSPAPLKDTDIYKVDVKGDPANITYGTSYRYSVPLFHRFGAGFVLGLPGKWRIDREKGEGKGLVIGIRGYDSDKRKKGGNMFAVDSSRVGRLKHVDGITPGFSPFDEFIPVSTREEKSEDNGPDYRSIEGKAKPVSEDIESVSSDEETVTYSEELRQRTIELDRKLQSHPHDIQSWLDYASLQDEIAIGQKASTAEIKLGILQKGLEKNPGETKLLVEIFKIETILWEPKKVLAHWNEVLAKHSNPELILEYLNYRQTSFSSFTYPEMVNVYSQCFTSLRMIAWKAIPSEKAQVERTILYVFQRFTTFAREAGYIELAIACFQSLIESNLFRPQLSIPTSETERDSELEQFEEFWELECSRFGEQGAKGWKSSDPDDDTLIYPTSEENEAFGTSIDEWYRREELSRGNMPGRTTDSFTDDDPYRVILFNDIKPFLYTFTTDIVQRLPYVFLTFCGVNLPHPEDSSNDMKDPWLHNNFDTFGFWPTSSHVEMIEWINGEVVEPERQSGIEGPFTFKRKLWPVDIDTLFPPAKSWFSYLEESDFNYVNTVFLMNALQQFKMTVQDEWFSIYHLAIENVVSPDTVLKLAKSYLKARKTSTALWNVYALLLWRRNQFDEARKVWKTAIEMTFSTHSNPICLWRTWITAEFELDSMKAREVMSLLSTEKPEFTQEGHIGGAGEMKTRKYLQDNLERALSFKHFDIWESFAFLTLLLEYLSSTNNLDAVITKYQHLIQSLEARGDIIGTIWHERFLLSTSKILYHHTQSQGWYKLSTLRNFWQTAITTFPHNTAFQSLFTWNEANSRIDGQVRKLLTSLEKTATLDTWIFTIWAEISVEKGRVSEYGVRAVFEKAVESSYYPAAEIIDFRRMSVILWILYIEFEARFGNPARAKDLVFRAMRECPWAKGLLFLSFLIVDLAMMAFGLLRDLFDQKDLARVYNVLVEKEIRIHGELEGMEDIPRRQIELPVDESSGED